MQVEPPGPRDVDLQCCAGTSAALTCRMQRSTVGCVIAGVIAACAPPADRQDGEHDAVTDGKADSGYSDGEINGALRVANELSFAELDDDVGLSSLTAQRIVQQRPFASLAELDAVPYVGPFALQQLVDYARGGFIHWLPLLEPVSTAGVSAGDGFGTRVALTEQYLAVSAPAADGGVGRVYMYERDASSWTLTQSLTLANAGISGFGRSITVDGDTMVVTTDSYQAFVFEHDQTGWNQAAELFGGRKAVALDGDFLAVDDVRWSSNMVRVYSRASGAWQAYDEVLTAPVHDLALRDSRLVVAMAHQGVTVFDLAGSGAVQVDYLPALATSVAMTSNRLAIGDSVLSRAGLYDLVGKDWVFSGAQPGAAELGTSVALDDNWLVAGAPEFSSDGGAPGGPTYEGAFYVYDQAGTLYEHRPATSRRGYFGTSIAMKAGIVVVGAPSDEGGIGVVYSN